MKKPYKIAVIDYGMSNMFSIKNALDMLGFECQVTSQRESVLSSAGAILPGVGAFPEAMMRIEQLGLDEVIGDFISSGKPFMGICLGFQLLFNGSEEMGKTNGLGLIKGKVKYFEKDSEGFRVPHVGWNSIEKNKLTDRNKTDGPLRNIDSGEYFYFVHSYYVDPASNMDIYTTTEYRGFKFCSSILKDNIFGCQFHPEKSGNEGVQVLKDMFNQ